MTKVRLRWRERGYRGVSLSRFFHVLSHFWERPNRPNIFSLFNGRAVRNPSFVRLFLEMRKCILLNIFESVLIFVLFRAALRNGRWLEPVPLAVAPLNSPCFVLNPRATALTDSQWIVSRKEP